MSRGMPSPLCRDDPAYSLSRRSKNICRLRPIPPTPTSQARLKTSTEVPRYFGTVGSCLVLVPLWMEFGVGGKWWLVIPPCFRVSSLPLAYQLEISETRMFQETAMQLILQLSRAGIPLRSIMSCSYNTSTLITSYYHGLSGMEFPTAFNATPAHMLHE